MSLKFNNFEKMGEMFRNAIAGKIVKEFAPLTDEQKAKIKANNPEVVAMMLVGVKNRDFLKHIHVYASNIKPRITDGGWFKTVICHVRVTLNTPAAERVAFSVEQLYREEGLKLVTLIAAGSFGEEVRERDGLSGEDVLKTVDVGIRSIIKTIENLRNEKILDSLLIRLSTKTKEEDEECLVDVTKVTDEFIEENIAAFFARIAATDESEEAPIN